ncbi:hypothetical protein SKAU_G00037060 [Synaphobranchus kaupii]|uniref:Uncharacterized protein n=1 Tax=Synaphobranchus kaupii TaxID=118154 RepID=A0A9Q1GG57_SYNKA|nr:hypothetical protein SKAU_G00037060 [Synaphobranchus kaupii]
MNDSVAWSARLKANAPGIAAAPHMRAALGQSWRCTVSELRVLSTPPGPQAAGGRGGRGPRFLQHHSQRAHSKHTQRSL